MPNKFSINLGICLVCSESSHTKWVDTDLGPYPVMTYLDIHDALSLGANSNSWFCHAHGQSSIVLLWLQNCVTAITVGYVLHTLPSYPCTTDTVDGILRIRLAKIFIFGECVLSYVRLEIYFKFELRLYIQQFTLLPHQNMDESFQDYS